MYVVSINFDSYFTIVVVLSTGIHLSRVISACALQVKDINDCLLLYAGSMVFNDNGRYYEGGTWVKTMYGAFSGPG